MRPRTTQPLRGPPSTLCDVIKHGFFHQIRLLVASGMNLEPRDNLGRTPIILCAFLQPEEWSGSLAMTLLEHGAKVSRRDRSGRNALHYACIYERQGLVRVLLGAIDYDLNQADRAGNTALHYAAMSGNMAVTQDLIRALRRYKVALDKVNKQGRTALEEAFFTGNGGCARIIEEELTGRHPGSAMKDVRFADDAAQLVVSQSMPVSPLLSSRGVLHPQRPVSAAPFLARRGSNSTMNSTEEKRISTMSRSRSNLSLHVGGYYRKSQNPLYSGGFRRDDELIECVSVNDFRNKPDYVFKMVHLPFNPCYTPNGVRSEILRDSTNNNWAETNSTCNSLLTPPGDWRRDFKLLYQVYENQCSPSWRQGRKCQKVRVETDPNCPGPSADDAEDMKGRKGPNLRRRMSVSRMKRLPSRSSVEGGALDTSSESINSMASSKKRGLEAGLGLAGGGANRSVPA